MDVFVLHGNEQGAEGLLRHLKVPHGTALPSGEFGGRVIVWGEQKAEAVIAALKKQLKAAAVVSNVSTVEGEELVEPDTLLLPGKPMKVTGLWSSAKPSKSSASSRKQGRSGGGNAEEGQVTTVGAEGIASIGMLTTGMLTTGTSASSPATAPSANSILSVRPSPPVVSPMTGSKAAVAGQAFDGFLAMPALPAEPLRQLQVHGMETDERTFGGGSEAELLRKDEALRDYAYLFRVPVFHLEPLTLFRLKREALLLAPGPGRRPGAFEEVGLAEPTYPSGRAVREAVKALYALGLDYGEAVIGIRPAGRLAVLDAWPQPDASLGALYAEAIGRYAANYARERQRMEPAMLGSDPEFLLVNPAGKVVAASRYLERDGEAGCDAIVLRGHRVITPLAELRPRPSEQPRKLAANLRRAMRLAASRISDASLVWLAGGMPLRGFPLGGHVHFSRVWLNSHLLRALDNYLALPLMLVEADTTRQRRPRYGFLGDFRRQPHGGFEYRTLPSWMVTPQMTVGVLSLARVIADGYRSLPGAGAGGGRPLDDIRLQEAYYSGDKTAVQPVVAQLWRDLERLPGYAEFAADLAPLGDRMLRMEPWNETADLRRAWKIPPFDGNRANGPEIML